MTEYTCLFMILLPALSLEPIIHISRKNNLLKGSEIFLIYLILYKLLSFVNFVKKHR